MAVVSDFGTNGTCSHGPATPSFYRVGEIRAPEDSDFAYFAGLADTHEDWTLKHDRNNVRVWMKETPGQTLKMMKVMANFTNISGRVLYETLQDADYRRTWDDAVMSEQIICLLEECSNSDICYYSMKCPNPLRNRDFVYQRCWRVTDKEYISFNHSVAHELFPPTRQFIRGVSQITGYVIREQPEGCVACYITQSDPRGQVPKWLLNLIASKIAPRVFQKIAQAAELYTEWKSKHNPDYKPWVHSEQYGAPTVSISSLKHFPDGEIPLTPRKGEPDDLGEEAELQEAEDIAPMEIMKVDQLLLDNVMHQKQEVVSS